MAEDQPPVESSTPDAPKAGAEAAAVESALEAVFDKASADTSVPGGADVIDQAAIDEILKQASFEDPAQAMGEGNETLPPDGLAGSSAAASVPPPPTEGVKLPNFQQVMQEAQVSSIDLLRDVDLHVKIELGRSRMLVEDVLKLGEGAVVELDKLAGDPVDVFINERLVARGEVLVLNDNFCVRINEIVAGVKEEGL